MNATQRMAPNTYPHMPAPPQVYALNLPGHVVDASKKMPQHTTTHTHFSTGVRPTNPIHHCTYFTLIHRCTPPTCLGASSTQQKECLPTHDHIHIFPPPFSTFFHLIHIFPQVYAPNLPGHVVNAAQRMGGGKAKPALELVGSSDELQAALKYAFGTSLVCEVSLCVCGFALF